MRISLIAAQSENKVIGMNNDLPWRVKGDWAFFKKTTIGKPLIAGRKTFESYPNGKALPKRTNIIVTRDESYKKDDAITTTSLEAAIEKAKEVAIETGVDEILIGGGAEIFKQALPFADRLYLNEIHCTVKGDAYFPEFNTDDWSLTFEEFNKAEPNDTADFTIRILDRK